MDLGKKEIVHGFSFKLKVEDYKFCVQKLAIKSKLNHCSVRQYEQLGSIDTIKNMKSLLRIIIGVLVGIAVFIGIAFVLGLIFRHFHVSFAKADYMGGCVDNAIYIGLGLAMIFLAPGQIKRKLESGKITEEKAKKASKYILPMGIVMIVYGILRIFGLL